MQMSIEKEKKNKRKKGQGQRPTFRGEETGDDGKEEGRVYLDIPRPLDLDLFNSCVASTQVSALIYNE